jgi:hypothetical protein
MKVFAFLIPCALAVALAAAQTPTPPKDASMTTTRAKGTFDVKLAPEAVSDNGQKAGLGRMSIEKQFHGDLEGASTGEMLATSVDSGSGGYVAIERVTATLAGRTGTFMLQHNGVMTRGTPGLTVSVLPDSGTGGLAGISGTMNIIITGGKHLYEFDYKLPQ